MGNKFYYLLSSPAWVFLFLSLAGSAPWAQRRSWVESGLCVYPRISAFWEQWPLYAPVGSLEFSGRWWDILPRMSVKNTLCLPTAFTWSTLKILNNFCSLKWIIFNLRGRRSPTAITSVVWFQEPSQAASPNTMTNVWDDTNRNGFLWDIDCFCFWFSPLVKGRQRCEKYAFQLFHVLLAGTRSKGSSARAFAVSSDRPGLNPVPSQVCDAGQLFCLTPESQRSHVMPATWSCYVDWNSWWGYRLRAVYWVLEQISQFCPLTVGWSWTNRLYLSFSDVLEPACSGSRRADFWIFINFVSRLLHCWQLKIGHGGSIYTREISKHCTAELHPPPPHQRTDSPAHYSLVCLWISSNNYNQIIYVKVSAQCLALRRLSLEDSCYNYYYTTTDNN